MRKIAFALLISASVVIVWGGLFFIVWKFIRPALIDAKHHRDVIGALMIAILSTPLGVIAGAIFATCINLSMKVLK